MKIRMFAAIAGLALYAPAANAAVNIYVSETNSRVFAQTLGSLDLTGVSSAPQATSGQGIRGTNNAFFFTGTPGVTVNGWAGLTGPLAFGSQLMSGPASTSGDPFGFNMGNNRVFLPTNYVSGAAINSSATYAPFSTLQSLGLNVGTYVYTLGRDTITLHIGEAAPAAVPEPVTWAMMLVGFAAIGFAMRRKQRQTVRLNFA